MKDVPDICPDVIFIYRLFDNELTGTCCSYLKEALESEHFSLLELDLSVNDLGQEGALLLCQGLHQPGCPIEKLLWVPNS